MQGGDRTTFRWVAGALAVAAVGAAFVGAEFDVGRLTGAKAAHGGGMFLKECWPPRHDAEFLSLLAGATLDTLSVAFLGTLLAVAIGIPLAAMSSRNVIYGARFAGADTPPAGTARAVFVASRTFTAAFRSVPEVVWALLFVKAAPLGALPAILAIGVAYGGLIGKVFSEQMEDVAPSPVAALEAVGAGRVRTFAWGVLPQAFGPMASYAAYRFECAVRASVLMGFVGAKGLGFELQVSYGDFLFGEVFTETAFLIVLVILIEWASDAMRRRIA